MSEQAIVEPFMKSMHIEMEVLINAPPERVFGALTENVLGWWDIECCTYKKGKMILEPEVGKRFYEDWGHGNGALFGLVSYIEQNRLLKIEGSIGMDAPVQGMISYELVPQGQATLLKFTHHAFGELSEDTEQTYTTGWKDMLAGRLRAYVE